MEVDKTRNHDAPPREETHLEPIDGVVQPPVVPSSHRPGRVTNQLQPKTQDYSIFCYLPPEILNHIFAILQLEDRKSVRLVCRSWYQYSTCPSITQNEKIVFRMNSKVRDIEEVMEKSNFSNLEFQGLSMIICLPDDILEVYGHRIRSLKFVECSANDETIKNIIIHCENLISFTWKTDYRRDIFLSSQFLDKLVHEGIERRKLRSFTLMMCDPLGEIVLNKLFLIYPCITHFAAETIPHQWFSYFPISLESLAFKKAPESKQWMEACIARAEQGHRLRHFNGIFDAEDTSYTTETMLKFFSCQKNLDTVTLLLLRCRSQEVMKRITFNILGSCPSLQEFHILFGDDSHFLYLEWEELLRLHTLISKLKCLSLGLRVSNISSIPLPRAPTTLLFSKNLALTSLDLRFNLTGYGEPWKRKNHNLYTALIQQCPQLLHLRLNSVSDRTLQIISKYLLKLQTLSIIDCRGTAYGFTGRGGSRGEGYSIKRLQQLKNLDIYGLGRAKRIGKILLEFQFPHLEYLALDLKVFRKVLKEDMIRLSFQIPNVRLLSIENTNRNDEADQLVLMKKIMCFSKYLKKLHCLTAKGVKFFDILVLNQVEKFFRCPSLTYVITDSCIYYFDPFTKEIQVYRDMRMNKFEFQELVFDNSFQDIIPLRVRGNFYLY